jgi:hypothetical protein
MQLVTCSNSVVIDEIHRNNVFTVATGTDDISSAHCYCDIINDAKQKQSVDLYRY